MSTKLSVNKNIPEDSERRVRPNFITEVIDCDLETGLHDLVVTRFPPEPNGYAHIGHAIASFIDFGLALDYGGCCHLRFDDTNPETEEMRYVNAIEEDMRWLGWEWGEHRYFTSDYFDELYGLAVRLIEMGKAYVDSLSEEEIHVCRGTVTEPGRSSPYRDRSVAENVGLFARMRAGEFENGAHVLRAKIDMTAPNMKMRDPLLYRIVHASHYRSGNKWCIYPMYDFAHPLSDAIEGVTHSLCSLEFVDNREVYDWLVDNLFAKPRPHQYEFGRRSLEYTVVSKRKLLELVNGAYVSAWDDPRMPTLAGLRRRGVTPEAIRNFAARVSISRTNRTVDIAQLEYSIREDLNHRAPRVMAVMDPLKVVITNYPEDKTEELDASYWPHDVPKEGSRKVPFARDLYIERSDFSEAPLKGWKRLSPGKEVRLRYAYVIKCDEVIKDDAGHVTELRCSYDPDTLGKNPTGRKVKGTIHWLSAQHALPAELRLYDRLFNVPNPDAGEKPFTDYLNPESLIIKCGFVEPSVKDDPADTRYQFERQGYFWQDAEDSAPAYLVFNRIVTLRDSWVKKEKEKAVTTSSKMTHKDKEKKAKPAASQAIAGEGSDPVAAFDNEQKARFGRLQSDFDLSRDDAALLATEAALSHYFFEAVKVHNNPQGIANWMVNELWRELKARRKGEQPFAPTDFPFEAHNLAQLVALIDANKINTRTAKDVFAEMLKTGDDPAVIVAREGLEQVTDAGELEPLIDQLITDNPEKVQAYRDGKSGLLGFFVGQIMRETGGKANPQLVQELLKARL